MGSEEIILKKVEAFASEAHRHQTRKYSPQPYIVHPVKVMKICSEYYSDISVLSAALLHDVLEDTDCSKEALLKFLNAVMDADDALMTIYFVEELTDVYTKSAYPRLNRRKRKVLEQQRLEKTSAEAQSVKYADIIDNCEEIVSSDPDFAQVFLGECRALLEKLNKGKRALRGRAIEIVENNIRALAKLRRRNLHALETIG